MQNAEAAAVLQDFKQQEAATAASQMQEQSRHKAADADIGDGKEQNGSTDPHKKTADANKEQEIADARALEMRLADDSFQVPGGFDREEDGQDTVVTRY